MSRMEVAGGINITSVAYGSFFGLGDNLDNIEEVRVYISIYIKEHNIFFSELSLVS